MILEEVTEHASLTQEGPEQVNYDYEIMLVMEALRAPVDKMEMIVDKEVWPMPSYGDLMFEV